MATTRAASRGEAAAAVNANRATSLIKGPGDVMLVDAEEEQESDRLRLIEGRLVFRGGGGEV